MTSCKNSISLIVAGTMLSLAAFSKPVWGVQPPPPAPPADSAAHTQHQQHQPQSATPPAVDQNKALVDQIAELRAQVARLEAALQQNHRQMQPMPASPNMQMQPGQGGGMQGMGGAGGMAGGQSGMGGMMGMMNQMMSSEMGGMGMGGGGGMAGMSQSGASGGGMPMGPSGMGGPGMGMKKMMGMNKMGQMPMPSMVVSALPGFPGASHIYHIGATGFFLDHPEHITLTTDQQTHLNQLREKAMLEQTTAQRKIDQGEQELWDLTASDSPDAAKIEAKVGEVEKLRSDQRLAFIRAVGKAATILTDDQRKQLTGMMPPAPTPPTQPQQPMQGGGAMNGHM